MQNLFSSKERKLFEKSSKGLISILSSHERFPSLAAGFVQGHANIACVNLSNSQYRYLLSSSSAKIRFSESINEAIDEAEKGKQIVWLYDLCSGQKPHLDSAVYLEREKLAIVRQNIDKIHKLCGRCRTPLDFYDFANVVNALTTSDFD